MCCKSSSLELLTKRVLTSTPPPPWQGSSIGDYGGLPGSANHNWLMQMLGACQGIEPKTYLTPKVKVPKLNFSPGFGPTKLPIKVVYPTLREIDASYGGRLVR